MRHFSKPIVRALMKPGSLAQSLLVTLLGVTLATTAGAADSDLPDPQLKLARDIESPVKRAATGTSASAPSQAAPAILTPLPGVKIAAPARVADAPRAKSDDADRGAVFLRADRIDGEGDRSVEAP